MQVIIHLLELLRRFGVKLGPYVLLELLLPGGTLFALLLFLHRHVKANGGSFAARLASPLAMVSALHDPSGQGTRVATSSHGIAAFA